MCAQRAHRRQAVSAQCAGASGGAAEYPGAAQLYFQVSPPPPCTTRSRLLHHFFLVMARHSPSQTLQPDAWCPYPAHVSVRSFGMPQVVDIGCLMLCGRCSSQAQAVETARVKAEHTCRLALMVVHRADSMLTAVSHHNDLTMAAAPTRVSSEAAEDDAKWEEDSVFPGALPPAACTTSTCTHRSTVVRALWTMSMQNQVLPKLQLGFVYIKGFTCWILREAAASFVVPVAVWGSRLKGV